MLSRECSYLVVLVVGSLLSIWYACWLQSKKNKDSNDTTTTLDPLPYKEDTDLTFETRTVMKMNSFGLGHRLRHMNCHRKTAQIIKKLHTYFGLHYDTIRDLLKAKQCMKRAILLAPKDNFSDLIHALPTLRMSQRDWFDDVEKEVNKGR